MTKKSDELTFWKDVHLVRPIAAGMLTLCWCYLEDKRERFYKGIPAYHYSWRLKGGPAPTSGYLLHHICGNHWCVNPSHLVVVSQITHRQLHATKMKAFCCHGHPYDEERPSVNGAGYRLCRECARQANKKYNRKQEIYLGKIGKLINVYGANQLERMLGGPQYNVKNWINGHQPIPTKHFARIDEFYNQLE